MILPLVVVAISAANAYFASRPEIAGEPKTWLFLLLPELPLALIACIALGRAGRLRERLLPHRGDVFLGTLTAAVLIIVVWSGRYLVMPHGSPRAAWLARLYLQLGDPQNLQQARWLPLVLIVGPILDEILWRGWMQTRLIDLLGFGRGYALTAGLYAISATPTMFTLADPLVGTNILVPLLAIVGGLVWGYVTILAGRATPAMIGHAIFAYFSVMEFRPPL
jgi:uncharacterized protein